ncbi:MAG: HEPN domain-containing protein [Fimbriiglobus sp.]|jgi:HEPN domain-containing protein|nr:HEPN domain-containing protein [Fimbriiglobus sp.]
MNRKTLQALARERVKDAKALLGRKRWAAAYYLIGYAAECGLKACVLRFVEEKGVIFGKKDGLKKLEGCWTHDLVKLVEIAELNAALKAEIQQDKKFDEYWSVVKGWNEGSRYQAKSETEARQLYEAINDPNHGVLKWIRTHW